MRLPASLKLAIPLFLVLAFFALDASAAIENAGVFDNILTKYQTAASGWSTYITARATWLFWTLVLISMVWTFGMMALRKADIGEFFAEFVRFTIFTGFFWWLLINGPSFAVSIYDSMRQMGSNASGLGNTMSPSSIVDVGFDIFFKVIDQSSVWSPVDSAVGIIIGAVILVILALVAVNMLLLLVSGWFLAYGGIFFLGFGGSRWTSDMAINYYKTVLGVGVQLMAMVLLVGIGKTFLDEYYTAMSAGITLKEMGVMLIVVVILLLLTNKIPSLLSGVITGASIGHAGIGNFGAGAALGAAGMATAAAATGGAMMAAGAANAAGGAQAIMAAFSKASENVTSGSDILSSMSGGSSESAANSSSDSSSSGSGNSSPFSAAAGIESSAGGSSTLSTAKAAATKAGRIAADAGANLASGAYSVGKEKASSMKEAAMERISETTGGKIATAIKASSSEDTPSFEDNSLSAETISNPEIAAFVNRETS